MTTISDASIETWSGMTQEQKNKEMVSVCDYGLIGDYQTDNLQAWNNLLSTGIKVWSVPNGVYRFSDGINIPNDFILIGKGSPILGFGTADDKYDIREGNKENIRGSVFIFSGTGLKKASQPIRADDMKEFSYMARVYNNTTGSRGCQIRGISFVQDMNCYRADNTVIKPTDSDANMADYDVGIVLDDTARGKFEDVCIFGYFQKSGLTILSKSGSDDPDYNTFTNCQFSGRYGVSLLGSDGSGEEEVTYGLSSTRFHRCGIYTLDHHARGRMTTDELISWWSTADTWHSVYIDGDITGASIAEINGHYFFDCEFRSSCEHIFKFDHASNIQFFGGVIENPMRNIANSEKATFLASENTKIGVAFYGVRNSNVGSIFNTNFIGKIGCPVTITSSLLNGRSIYATKDPNDSSRYSAVVIGGDGGNGDIGIQFTRDVSSGNNDWQICLDASDTANNPLLIKYNSEICTKILGSTKQLVNNYTFYNGGKAIFADSISIQKNLEVAGTLNLNKLTQLSSALIPIDGAVTITSSYHSINGTTTLSTINGGTTGQRLIIRPTSSVDVLTINKLGNIRFSNASFIKLEGSLKFIEFIYTGAVWVLIGDTLPSDNVKTLVGSGTPESNIVASVGSVYHRTDENEESNFYVKETGTGNTGWVAK